MSTTAGHSTYSPNKPISETFLSRQIIQNETHPARLTRLINQVQNINVHYNQTKRCKRMQTYYPKETDLMKKNKGKQSRSVALSRRRQNRATGPGRNRQLLRIRIWVRRSLDRYKHIPNQISQRTASIGTPNQLQIDKCYPLDMFESSAHGRD